MNEKQDLEDGLTEDSAIRFDQGTELPSEVVRENLKRVQERCLDAREGIDPDAPVRVSANRD